MHVTLRRYTRPDAPRQSIVDAVNRGLVPILKQLRGFRGYCAFWSEEGYAVSMSVFEGQETAEVAQAEARHWVQQSGSLFPEAPEVFSGRCAFHALAEEREQHDDSERALYVTVQEFGAVPPLDRIRGIAQDLLIPAITRSPGFRGVYMVRSEHEQDRAAVVTLFDGKGDAERCHNRLIELMQEHLPEVRAESLVRGPTAIMVVGG